MKKKLSLLVAMLIAAGAPLVSDCPAPASVPAKKARKLLEQQGCLHCHFVSGDGGFIGPPLDGIGKHRSREFIEALEGRLGSPAAALPAERFREEVESGPCPYRPGA